jgi:release factor glutamine methyltransferase
MKLSEATHRLSEAGIADARGEARILFSHFTDLPSALLYGGDAESDSQTLAEAVEKRISRIPLQHIVGEVFFYRESYRVTPDVLIPRSDTEILVDEVIKRLPPAERFADICTGSGCIALSVLNNTVGTAAAALDISPAALDVARENAKRLSLCDRISFTEGDALTNALDGEFFAIVSNPPYVTPTAYAALEPEIYFEPKIAFLGGDDGLEFYRKIIPMYKERLKKGGFFAFEIGYDQGDALRLIAAEHSLSSQVIKDYSGNDRVVILTAK